MEIWELPTCHNDEDWMSPYTMAGLNSARNTASEFAITLIVLIWYPHNHTRSCAAEFPTLESFIPFMIKRWHPKSALEVLFHGQQKFTFCSIIIMQREVNVKTLQCGMRHGGPKWWRGVYLGSVMWGTPGAVLAAAGQVRVWPWTFLSALCRSLLQWSWNEGITWGLAVMPGAETKRKRGEGPEVASLSVTSSH